ncbi:DUF397 domain-containing protein [Glycomyces salinus]|uniref:DUF397 domain-containing protein n=1 Tax=Glycomyces salinus TaxID=980294 RepID=UPI0018EDC1DD|nr:DUF397 domain-containing protein [Glycomyces salinus]
MLTNEWRKSSRSNNQGGACVEARFLTAEWKKSSRSDNQGGACVEVRAHNGVVQVRDTKLGDTSPVLDASPAAWRALLTHEGHSA